MTVSFADGFWQYLHDCFEEGKDAYVRFVGDLSPPEAMRVVAPLIVDLIIEKADNVHEFGIAHYFGPAPTTDGLSLDLEIDVDNVDIFFRELPAVLEAHWSGQITHHNFVEDIPLDSTKAQAAAVWVTKDDAKMRAAMLAAADWIGKHYERLVFKAAGPISCTATELSQLAEWSHESGLGFVVGGRNDAGSATARFMGDGAAVGLIGNGDIVTSVPELGRLLEAVGTHLDYGAVLSDSIDWQKALGLLWSQGAEGLQVRLAGRDWLPAIAQVQVVQGPFVGAFVEDGRWNVTDLGSERWLVSYANSDLLPGGFTALEVPPALRQVAAAPDFSVYSTLALEAANGRLEIVDTEIFWT